MKQWGVDKASFGPAMSAALFGMALGAGIGGWLGDRVGRKTIHVGATLLFGLCTLGVAFANSLEMLIALRLAAGLGFGALAPNGAALVSEWLPTRARPGAMALLSITIPLGGLIGGARCWRCCPRWDGAVASSRAGWSRWRCRRGCSRCCPNRRLSRHARTPRQGRPAGGARDRPGARCRASRSVRRAAPSAVFTRDNLRLNTGSWLAFFCLQLIAYGFLSWAPVFLTMAGWPLESAIRGTLVFNLSAVCASLATGWLLGRVQFRSLALVGSIGAALGLVLLYLLASNSRRR